MRLGLRTRVAIAFGLLSLVIATAVSSATYFFAAYYLLNQREDAALTRALLDSRAVGASLSIGATPSKPLNKYRRWAPLKPSFGQPIPGTPPG